MFNNDSHERNFLSRKVKEGEKRGKENNKNRVNGTNQKIQNKVRPDSAGAEAFQTEAASEMVPQGDQQDLEGDFRCRTEQKPRDVYNYSNIMLFTSHNCLEHS